jgi:hypothetical protein
MEDITQYYTTIEQALTALNIAPATARGEQLGQWNLQHGSAQVWIDCWHIERQGRAYYQVMSPVMEIPSDNTGQLMEELLHLNDKLFGVSFSLYKGLVWMKTIRECRGMDAEEAQNILARIATYANMYDDYLIAKYAGRKPADGSVSAPGTPPADHA